MLPIRDRNPTYHPAVATGFLIAICVVVLAVIQPGLGERENIRLPDGSIAVIDASARFAYEFAAVPCEITEVRPLDTLEIRDALSGRDDRCQDTAASPLFPGKHVWFAAIVSMFLHGDWLHLGSNMLFMWIFGNNIEDHVGPLRFVAFYLLAGVAATATHIALQPDSAIPVIGASGAVAGVMGAYLVWFPRARVTTLIMMVIPRDIRAGWLLTAWFVLQFFTAPESGVAWAAHVGGFAFGALVAAVIRFTPGARQWAWREPWRATARLRWDSTGDGGWR